jgi:Fe-S cluster biogenesis protein NfuA
MFIQTEPTPNPATLKFLPGRPVLEEGSFEATTAAEAERSPLAKALLGIPGVRGVFLAPDFISVTKAEGDWAQLRPAVLGVVTEFFLSGVPALTGAASADEEFYDAADQEVVDTIKDLIETRVRPAVAGDGGDITFKGFRDGVVFLGMKGACSGCPSSTATLKHGIENLFKHFLPEVKGVEQF